MKLIEKILFVGIVIALFLKFLLIAGGDMLLLYFTVPLVVIYFPFGFLFFNRIRLRHISRASSYTDLSGQKIGIAAIAGLALSLVCLGSLYRLLYLAGGNDMLKTGLVLLLISIVFSLAHIVKDHDGYYKFISWRSGIIGFIGAVLFFATEMDIISVQYRNHPDYIKAYSEYLRDPGNKELNRKKELERYRIILSKEEFELYRQINEAQEAK